MNNKERLNEILIIRDLRRNLMNFDISNEEKAIILRALNEYEERLGFDIQESIKNKEILEDMNIKSDIDVVKIPIDENRPSYNELVNIRIGISFHDIVLKIQDILSNETLFNIDTSSKKVLLSSLKEYCRSIQNLKLERETYKRDYPELFHEEELKNNINL